MINVISLTFRRDLCREGLRIAVADNNKEQLDAVTAEVAQIVGEPNVIAAVTDVSKVEEVQRFKEKVFEQWGEVSWVTSLQVIECLAGCRKLPDNLTRAYL